VGLCHHGMARPRVADRGNGLRMWRVTVADSRQRVVLQLVGGARGLQLTTHTQNSLLQNITWDLEIGRILWNDLCMYVQLSARRLVGSSYSAGTRCAYPHTHVHAYTCTCTCRYILINTHTAHPIPPPLGVLSQELNGVE
jgi:hypothetical protein